MIKLILSDMDGTLLDEAGNMPAGFDDVMAQLHERGVMFAPASGRQYQSLVESFSCFTSQLMASCTFFSEAVPSSRSLSCISKAPSPTTT